MAITLNEKGFATESHSIAWEELDAVGLRTTSAGPFVEDVFWLLLWHGGCLELPGSVVQGEVFAALIDHLPGFDAIKIVQAMASVDQRTWRIWRKGQTDPLTQSAVLAQRFCELVERLGGQPQAWSREILARWGEPHRHYHTAEHLAACLAELDSMPTPDADVIELALFFHDAIWRGAPDDEVQSAALLQKAGKDMGLPAATLEHAVALVLCTAHDQPLAGAVAGADLVRDIDLAVLGTDVLGFLEYDDAVCEELSAWHHPWVVRIGRGRFLGNLLKQRAIFKTSALNDRYEAAARANLEAVWGSPRYRVARLLAWLGW